MAYRTASQKVILKEPNSILVVFTGVCDVLGRAARVDSIHFLEHVANCPHCKELFRA